MLLNASTLARTHPLVRAFLHSLEGNPKGLEGPDRCVPPSASGNIPVISSFGNIGIRHIRDSARIGPMSRVVPAAVADWP